MADYETNGHHEQGMFEESRSTSIEDGHESGVVSDDNSLVDHHHSHDHHSHAHVMAPPEEDMISSADNSSSLSVPNDIAENDVEVGDSSLEETSSIEDNVNENGTASAETLGVPPEVIDTTPNTGSSHSHSEDPDSDPLSAEMGQDEDSYEELSEDGYAELLASLDTDEVLSNPANASNPTILDTSEEEAGDSDDATEIEEINVDNLPPVAENFAKENDAVSTNQFNSVTESLFHDTNHNTVHEAPGTTQTTLEIVDFDPETQHPDKIDEVQDEDNIIDHGGNNNMVSSFGISADPSSNLLFMTLAIITCLNSWNYVRY